MKRVIKAEPHDWEHACPLEDVTDEREGTNQHKNNHFCHHRLENIRGRVVALCLCSITSPSLRLHCHSDQSAPTLSLFTPQVVKKTR